MSYPQTAQENYTKPYVPDDIEKTKSYLTELHLEDIVDRAIDSYKMNFGGDDFHYFNYGYNRNLSNSPALANTSGTLTVTSVDLKVKANGRAHRTNRFGISKSRNNSLLVVRRGQAFSVDVTLSRAYDEKVDDLKICFKAGQYGSTVNGTFVEFMLSAQSNTKSWGARLTNKQGNVLTLDIVTPPTCYIGKWTLMIDVIKKQNIRTNVLRYQHKDPIYVIFNPWSLEDSVYMDNQQDLDEYVLNEYGVIFNGTAFEVSMMYWYYGQFENIVLDIAMYLLDIGGLDWQNRGNPILIARKISALVNSNDNDGGIVVGKWGDHYPGGIHPSAWTGSIEILKQYWSTKRAVKYGQCWVFCGVTTTICRALGIPTRSITNFNSAHDADGSITITLEYNARGKLIGGPGRDSMWNFHCWNEGYMTRPDLPSGYRGWQVFDGTPQEPSEGVRQCGPVPVSAIKKGEVQIPYDGPFVFSEVNGDVYSWKPNRNGMMELFDVSFNRSGTLICCKAVNSNSLENLTLTYKHPEGSPEERAAVLKVNQTASSRRYMLAPKPGQLKDVTFTVVNDASKNLLGSALSVGLNIKNTSSSKRTASGTVSSRSVYYTGVLGHDIKTLPFKDIVLNPGEEKTIGLEISPEEYSDKLVDRSIIDVSFLSEIEENNQKFATKESFSLRSPPLIITAPSEGTRNTELTIELSFTNPLNLSLSNCVVVVDGICTVVRIPVGDVAPLANFRTTVRITPCRSGKRELIAAFSSDNLHGVTGTQSIIIKK